MGQYVNELIALGRVGLAMVLGAAIGFERELEDKPAGLRTHMLVGGAATLFVGLASVIVQHISGQIGPGLIRSDPIRIVEAVVTGVSFLGAGTIVLRRGRGRVEGLTTAASILFTAAVGVAVALSLYVLSVGVTALILVTLRGIGIVEDRLQRRRLDGEGGP